MGPCKQTFWQYVCEFTLSKRLICLRLKQAPASYTWRRFVPKVCTTWEVLGRGAFIWYVQRVKKVALLLTMSLSPQRKREWIILPATVSLPFLSFPSLSLMKEELWSLRQQRAAPPVFGWGVPFFSPSSSSSSSSIYLFEPPLISLHTSFSPPLLPALSLAAWRHSLSLLLRSSLGPWRYNQGTELKIRKCPCRRDTLDGALWCLLGNLKFICCHTSFYTLPLPHSLTLSPYAFLSSSPSSAIMYYSLRKRAGPGGNTNVKRIVQVFLKALSCLLFFMFCLCEDRINHWMFFWL